MTSGTFSTRVQWYSGHGVAKRKAQRAPGRALKHMLCSCCRAQTEERRHLLLFTPLPSQKWFQGDVWNKKRHPLSWTYFSDRKLSFAKSFFAGDSEIQLINWKSHWLLSGLIAIAALMKRFWFCECRPVGWTAGVCVSKQRAWSWVIIFHHLNTSRFSSEPKTVISQLRRSIINQLMTGSQRRSHCWSGFCRFPRTDDFHWREK